jgi:hypothetical protein
MGEKNKETLMLGGTRGVRHHQGIYGRSMTKSSQTNHSLCFALSRTLIISNHQNKSTQIGDFI